MFIVTHHPAAAPGAPNHVIAFPTERTRPPAAGSRRLDGHEWWRCFTAAWAVESYRDLDAEAAAAAIAAMIDRAGPGAVAGLLEETAGALALLRGVVATLVETDRRIVEAAERVLTAADLEPRS